MPSAACRGSSVAGAELGLLRELRIESGVSRPIEEAMAEVLLDPLISIVAGSAVGIAAVDAVKLVQRLFSRSGDQSS